jgi:uncharacterized membrane protein HdeD (DUF308 family)
MHRGESMPYTRIEVRMNDEARRSLRNTGIVLVILGLVGIVLPEVLSVTLAWLVGGLLLAAGVIGAYAVWSGYRRDGLAWLKPFVLVVLGLLLLLYPGIGAAAIGLLIIVYFLMSGFAGIAFGLGLRPLPGWGWNVFSGAVSVLLAMVFIWGWPFDSLWLVGLFVGISLLLDGIALLVLSRAA